MTDTSDDGEDPTNDQMIVLEPDSVVSPDRSRNKVLFVVGSVVGVVVIGGGIAIGLMVASFGAPDASIRAMPANTEFYVNIDLRVFLDSDIGRIADTFPDLFDDPDNAEQEVFDEFSQPIQGTSLDFSEDITPWIGRSVGFGIWNLDSLFPFVLAPESEIMPEEDQPTFLVVVSNRDPGAATDVLVKLAAEEGGTEVEPIDGNVVFRFDSDDSESVPPELDAFASQYLMVSGNLGLMSNTRTGLETAVAVQAGEQPSLADEEAYAETLALLPNGPGSIFAYGSPYLIETYSEATAQAFGDLVGSGAEPEPIDAAGGFAVSFDINDDGFRIDVAQHFATASLDPLETRGFALASTERLTSMMPQTTIGYLAFIADIEQTLYEVVESTYETTVAAGGLDTASLPEALTDLEGEIGIPPGTLRDLIESIDPGIAIYVSDTLSPSNGVEATALIPLNDPAVARSSIDTLMFNLALDEAAPTELGWAIDNEVYFGVVDDVIFVTSGEVPSLANTPVTASATHEAVADALATRQIWGFLDLDRAFDYAVSLPESGVIEADVAPYRPFNALGFGGEFTETTAAYSFVVLIDWAEPGN